MTWIEFVEKASLDAAKEGMINIKNNHFPFNEFLSIDNPLRVNTIENVQKHFSNALPNFEIDSTDAKSYLAASSVIHSFDGWHYLTASINALLNGDVSVAIHLAYYAELRATSSFLASEGIGVFKTHHFCLSANSQLVKDPYSQSTHKFIWNAIQKWGESPKQSNILNYFIYNGKSFREWLPYIPNSNTERVTPLFIKDWLTKWCFDIKEFENDRDVRNLLSYRPFYNRVSPYPNLSEKAGMINSFWKILEPNDSNRFAVLDKYLFSIFLKKIHKNLTDAGIIYSMDQLLEETYSNAGLSMDLSLKSIFLSDFNHVIIEKALDKSIDENEMPDPFAIISRAILMLRVSTGSTSFLLKSANVTREDLNFYVDKVGIDGGFWNKDEMPEDFCDLWMDINDLLLDFENYSSNPDLSLKQLIDENFNISTYSQFNRAAIWGMGL